MSKEYRESYDKVLNILFPGYSDLSDKRKDAIEFRTMGITAYASEIMELFEQMKNPENSLYQEGVSDKDIVNIAAIYARIHEESNKQIGSPTGKMLKGGDYGNVPTPEYEYRDRTEQEVQDAIRIAVEKYKSTQKISIKNILNGIKQYNIDYNTALNVSKILKEKNTQTKDSRTTDDKEMEK